MNSYVISEESAYKLNMFFGSLKKLFLKGLGAMKKNILAILAGTATILTAFSVAFASAPLEVIEPNTLMLLGAGVAGLVGAGIIKNRKK
jgi:hypothetical protein